MANPNIISATSIYGKVDMAAITTSATALITCGSNKVLKVNGIFVSNISASSSGLVTIDIYRSSTARRLANNVAVTINEMLDVLGGKALYLNESDQLRFTADANSILEAVVTYEEIA